MALHQVVPQVPSLLTLANNMQPWLTLIPMALTGGLGYWWGNRGVSGMKADLATLQADVQYLKGKFDGSTSTPVVALPAPVPVTPVQPASS